jgi:hypothetical protein
VSQRLYDQLQHLMYGRRMNHHCVFDSNVQIVQERHIRKGRLYVHSYRLYCRCGNSCFYYPEAPKELQ